MSRPALVLARLACTLFAAFALALPMQAQIVMTSDLDHQVEHRCATPSLSLEERMAMVESARGANARWPGDELVVPVAYHVITRTTGSGNIPDERLDAQTDSLNRQFEGTGIRFVTLSVDRTANTDWFNNIDLGNALERTVKAELAIDPERVLNLYFSNIEALGWCYFPSSFAESSTRHGCFMATGTEPGGNLAPYNGGDTATHEIGHFFGLFHTFQGGCNGGDLIDDTPAERTPNFNGCNLMRDTCTDEPGFDPVTNFMDYSVDACLNEFTPGQVVRMQEQVAARKPTLLLGQTTGPGVSRTGFNFGTQFVGSVSSTTLFVANFATQDGPAFSIQDITVDNEAYQISFPDILIPVTPGQRFPITVDFVPTEEGAADATLTITTDDPDFPTLEVRLGGEGSLASAVVVDRAELELEIDEGTIGEAIGTISSVGASDLTFAFADLAPASFVSAITPSSGSIAPGEEENIAFTVDATALLPGEYEESFTFTTNAPDGAELAFTIALTVTQVVSTEERGGPLTFELDGNFPNPFALTTTLRFTLAEAAPTTLAVYDAAGNEVHRLIDQTLAAGAHAIPFDATNLSSGAYFYRLVSGANRATGSMVLLR